MKPISLEFQAFLSYRDKMHIDFTIFNNSIFLIDGDTGAGKTTIFDAMCFALYGEASDNARGNNFKSHYASIDDLCYVEFVFEEKGEIYKIHREPAQIKRKKKGRDEFGNLGTKSEGENVLYTTPKKQITKKTEADKAIVELIKLKKDQFRNTIMIGQNKFSELIRTTTSARKDLFRNILQTQKFEDFEDKLSKLYASASKEIESSNVKIDTELKGYKTNNIDLSEKLNIDNPSLNDFDTLYILLKADLDLTDNKLKELENNKNQENEKLTELNKNFETAKINNKNIEEFKNHKELFDSICKEEDKYKNLNDIINKYDDSYETYFISQNIANKEAEIQKLKSDLNLSKENKVKCEENLKEASQKKDKNVEIEKENENINSELNKLNNLFDKCQNLENEKIKELELNKGISLINQEISSENKKQDILNGKLNEINDFIEKNNDIDVKISKLQSAIEHQETEKNDLEKNIQTILLMNSNIQMLQENYLGVVSKSSELKSTLEETNKELNTLNEYNSLNKDCKLEYNELKNQIKDIDNKIQTLNDYLIDFNKINKKKTELEKDSTKLDFLSKERLEKNNRYIELDTLYQNNLAGILAKNLIEGSPCPVCGAIHHTNLAKLENDSVTEETLKKAQKEKEEANQAYNDSLGKYKANNDNLNEQYKGLIDKLKTLLTINDDNVEFVIQNNINLLNYKKSELSSKINDLNAVIANVDKNEERMKALTSSKENITKNISENEKNETAILTKINTLSEEITNLRKDLITLCSLQNDDNLIVKAREILANKIKELEVLKNQEESFRKISKELAEFKENQNKISKELEDSKNKVKDAEIARASTSEALKHCKDNIKSFENDLQGKTKEIIENEISENKQKYDKNKDEIDSINSLYVNVNKEFERINTHINYLNNDIQNKNNESKKLQKELEESLNKTILKDLSVIKSLVLEYKDSIDSIKRSAQKYKDDYTKAESLYKNDLDKNFDKLTSTNLEELNAEIINQTKILKDKEDEYNNLNSTLHNNLQRFNNYVEINKSINEKSVRVSNLKKLNEVSKGQVKDKEKIDFETYYQSQIFNNILTQANKRLNVMTDNVYSMIRHESEDEKGSTALDIDIFDTNTGKVRSANSLSGGEIFMASLSLALGFSEISRTKSGANELDCMFIDEGFGTLDEETLRTVMRVLNQLSNETNRTIGIISHVTELRDAIHKQIHVTKDKINGSKLEFKI